MNNNKKILIGMGAVTLLVLGTLVPLKTCAVKPVKNNLETPTEITKEVEDVDFSKYEQVKEPLEDAKEGMFKVNLVTKDGKVTRIDSEFQNGIKVLKGRTAVSMYDMSQTVSGIDLSWDQGSRIATAKNEGNELKYPIDRRVMTRNGELAKLDVAATVDSKVNRTYLPLRSLMESLGYDVEYHDGSGTIDILEKGAPKQDHSKDTVKKPEVKPGNEKPEGVGGKKAVVEKDRTSGSGIRTVTYSLPELEDLLDVKSNFKDALKGKTIINSDGRNMTAIYNDYKLMDGSYYYSDINTEMDLSFAQNKGELNSIYMKESTFADSFKDPAHGNDPRFDEMQTYAFEDDKGNVYIADGFKISNKNDIYTGKTIKHVYHISNKHDVIIKVTFQDPKPIGK